MEESHFPARADTAWEQPRSWLQFHQVSLVTVPANVVGVPVVAEMLVLALATAAIAPVAPWLAAPLARANGIGALFVAECARFFGGLPGAEIRSPAAVAAVAAVLVSLAAWRISSPSISFPAATGRRSRVPSAVSGTESATTRRST